VHYQTAYRWVRDGVLPAVKFGAGYRLDPADVEALSQRRLAQQPVSYTGRRRDWSRLRDQLREALVVGDETGARRVFERIRLARVPLLEQCEQLVAPVMRCLEAEWEADGPAGARLRLAAGIAERCLAWALDGVAAPRRGSVVVAGPPGEPHRLPPLMAAAVLRDAGWGVRPVAGLCSDDMLTFVRGVRPALVVLSPTLPGAVAEGIDLAGRLQREGGVPALVGRPGESLAELRDAATAVQDVVPGRRRRPLGG
jgi:excisionase family DNA binding protein